MVISRRHLVSLLAGSIIAFLGYGLYSRSEDGPDEGLNQGLEDPESGYGLNGFGIGEYGG